MKKMILLVAMMLAAASSFAVVDMDDDMMGFYFDLDANNPCEDGVAPYTTITLYLILTRPTTDFIYGFEAGFDVEGDAIILSAEFAAENFINVGNNENIIAGFGEPYPTSEATLLVSFQVMYTSTALDPVDFLLHGSDPSSMDPMYPVILLADGVLQSVGLSAEFGPTAQINGGCNVVATDNVSFDGIKSLYR